MAYIVMCDGEPAAYAFTKKDIDEKTQEILYNGIALGGGEYVFSSVEVDDCYYRAVSGEHLVFKMGMSRGEALDRLYHLEDWYEEKIEDRIFASKGELILDSELIRWVKLREDVYGAINAVETGDLIEPDFDNLVDWGIEDPDTHDDLNKIQLDHRANEDIKDDDTKYQAFEDVLKHLKMNLR